MCPATPAMAICRGFGTVLTGSRVGSSFASSRKPRRRAWSSGLGTQDRNGRSGRRRSANAPMGLCDAALKGGPVATPARAVLRSLALLRRPHGGINGHHSPPRASVPLHACLLSTPPPIEAAFFWICRLSYPVGSSYGPDRNPRSRSFVSITAIDSVPLSSSFFLIFFMVAMHLPMWW